MKILVDTNIMIDYLKRPSEEMKNVFSDEEILITGVLVSELLHGAISDKELRSLEEDLSVYECLNIQNDEWFSFGRFLNVLRRNGLTLPYADALIAHIAINHNVPVWTNDKHFKLIQTIDDRLQLYDTNC